MSKNFLLQLHRSQTVMLIFSLIFFVSCSNCSTISSDTAGLDEQQWKLRFAMHPKGHVPPSGPSKGVPPSKAGLDKQKGKLRFVMHPKGRVPPSGPSKGVPVPPSEAGLDKQEGKLRFLMHPKGHVPPSGPFKGVPPSGLAH